MSSLLVFYRVYRLEIQSVMLVFSTQLRELLYCSSSILSGSPPPIHKVKVQFIKTVCSWDGVGGVELCWRPFLQELNTMYLTRFRKYKNCFTFKEKPRRGGGLRQINACRTVPLQVNFLK
jgi:hypothetical protein